MGRLRCLAGRWRHSDPLHLRRDGGAGRCLPRRRGKRLDSFITDPTTPVAAISAGIVDGEPLLDLDYPEDSQADVDMNVVMNANGEFIELQSAAERNSLRPQQLTQLLDFCDRGIRRIFDLQEQSLQES